MQSEEEPCAREAHPLLPLFSRLLLGLHPALLLLLLLDFLLLILLLTLFVGNWKATAAGADGM